MPMKLYSIQVAGQVDVNELNPMSPQYMTAIKLGPTLTLFTICTDQSGLLGLLRHLHKLGIMLLVVTCEENS